VERCDRPPEVGRLAKVFPMQLVKNAFHFISGVIANLK
jgi:hypothetical protein